MYILRQLGSARLRSGVMRPSALFSIKPKFKMHFFNRNIIRTNWSRINKDPLQKAGVVVMKIARGSIRRRKRSKPSPVGTPPYSHKLGTTPPFKMIYSVPFRLGTSVIVGMVGFGGSTPPPGLQEHGGAAQRFVYTNLGRKRLKSGRFGKTRWKYSRKLVKYPQRAFMEPALLRAKARNVLPRFWQASIGRSSM